MNKPEENVTIITEPVAVRALKKIYDNNGPGNLEWHFDIPGQVSATDGSIIGNDGELSNLLIGDKSLHGILIVHDICSLKTITAWGNTFIAVDLKDLIKLTDLDLGANEIEHLGTIDNLPVLESLLLELNNIKELSSLAGLQSLRWLVLEENPLEDISVLFKEFHPDLQIRISYPKINPQCGLKCIHRQVQALNARILINDEECDNDFLDMDDQEDAVIPF